MMLTINGNADGADVLAREVLEQGLQVNWLLVVRVDRGVRSLAHYGDDW